MTEPMTRAEQLEVWFTYHPPTEETKPKYAAIKEAYGQMYAAFRAGVVAAEGAGKATPADFERVTTRAREFAEAIDTHCPKCADATAAVRCLRLARNAMNDTLRSAKTPHADFQALAHQQLELARYQANSAIACGGV